MMDKIKLLVGTLIAAIAIFAAVAPPTSYAAFDGAKGQACGGVNLSNGSGACADSSGKLSTIIGVVINILSVIVGIVAVIFIMVGGFKFITSGGDAQSIASARMTILYAVVGLVVVAMAQIVVKYVLHRVSLGLGGP